MKMLSPSPGRKSGIIISLSGPINADMSSHLHSVGNGLETPGTGNSNPIYKHRCLSEGLHQTPVPNFPLCDPGSALCTVPLQKARISYLHDANAL